MFKSFGGSLDSDLSAASSRAFVSDIDIGSGLLWTPCKTLCNIVNTSIENPTNENFSLLSQELKRQRHYFQSRQFLTSKAPNSVDRDEIKKSVNEPILLFGYEEGKVLPMQLVNETLMISDLFEINEFLALDLVVTGEAELENFPCWARGLVAVYIYFEGLFSVVSTLRTMLQVCPGNTWSSKAHPKLIETFNAILENILTDEFMDKALSLIDKYTVRKQVEALDNHLGLGDWRHRTGIVQFITAIREGLADIVFYWSAQRGLRWPETLRILEYFKSHISLTEDYRITKEDICLLSAVLYSVDFNLNTDKFDKEYLASIRKYYKDNISVKEFLCHEILDVLKLSYHVAVHKRLYEASLTSICTGSSQPDTIQGLMGDEVLEFKTDVFHFLKVELFYDTSKFSEESILRLFHQLFSDFIIYMPTRLKEFKTKSVEASKLADMYQEQGLPHLPEISHRVYDNFLQALGAFYSADEKLELALDYFRPDPSLGALNKLVRSACVDSISLFPANAKMLAGIGFSYPSGVLDLLSHPGHNLSVDHFFDSIVQFLKTTGSQFLGDFDVPPMHSSGYKGDMFPRGPMNPAKLKSRDVAGICGYLDLLKNVCQKSANARRYFTTVRRHWFRLVLISAKESLFPREIRVYLMDLAAAMIDQDTVSTEYVMSLWEMFYSAKFVERGTADLREELEETESRFETYGLTIRFLKFFDVLVQARFSTEVQSPYDISQGTTIDGDLLEPYIAYIRDAVFQKVRYRPYKNIKERWVIIKLCLQILSTLLDYVPHLMIQMLCDTPLLRGCLTTITDCTRVRSISTGPTPELDECSLACLTLISRVYDRQESYLYRRDLNSIEYQVVLIGIQELLMKVHSESGRAEYLLAILKFVDKVNPDSLRDIALKILAKLIASQSDTDVQLYNAVIGDANTAAIVRNTFIECLYSPSCSDEVKRDVLQLLKSSVVHPSPNFGFFMLAIDKRIEFQQPGVNGYPRTVLHALLDNLASLPTGFQTLYSLIRDPRLNGPILRYLRSNQLLVKFYVDSFPSPDMEVEAMGFFLKCLALELKSTQSPGPLTHALAGKFSYKFISVLEKIKIEAEEMELKNFEFFDNGQILEAFQKCEYIDRQFKVKLVDHRKLEELLSHEIAQLDRATLLRLRKSIQGESKEIIAFVLQRNESRRRESSKVFLFECWRQCLEILLLSLTSVRVVGMPYVANMIQMLSEKAVTAIETRPAFQRLVAETTTTLCAVLNVFEDEMSVSTLGVIIFHLCTWVSKEDSVVTRAYLYSSLLHLMNFTKDQKVDGTVHSSFAIIIDHLCKDSQKANDIGRMQATYLLGEIIRWNIAKGLGGVVPDTATAIKKVGEELAGTKIRNGTGMDSSFSRNMSANQSSLTTVDTTGLHSALVNRQKRLANIAETSLSPGNHSTTNGADKSVLTNLNLARTSHLMYSTEAALTAYLHDKGFVKNVILSLSGEDDGHLVHLFSPAPEPAHLRAMLIFEAKMFMLTRFANSGPAATQLLLDSGVIRSLMDMQVFFSGRNLDAEQRLWPARSMNRTGYNKSRQPQRVALPTKLERLDNLFSTVLMLFHAMLETKPKNDSGDTLIPGIWNFVTTHDESLAHLIIYPGEDGDTGSSLYLLTSLLPLIAYETPDDLFHPRSQIFERLTAILRVHVLSSGDWLEQLHLVRDVMMFLFRYSVRRSGKARAKGVVPCDPILEAKMEYSTQGAPSETGIDLSIGLILKVVHDTARLAYQVHDHEDMHTMYLVEIMEMGLTLVSWHVELILRDMFSTVGDFHQDQLQFQADLRNTIEGAFLKDAADAIGIFMNDMDYTRTMLMSIRRFAHIQKF